MANGRMSGKSIRIPLIVATEPIDYSDDKGNTARKNY